MKKLSKLFERSASPRISHAGTKRWYLNGQLHREGGPAVEYASGSKYWYRDGQFHREDGPAIERADGYKAWFVAGHLHRDFGPAVEQPDGGKEWYRNGRQLSAQEIGAQTKTSIGGGLQGPFVVPRPLKLKL